MKKLKPVLILVAILYAIWLVDFILPWDINSLGNVPRTKFGLIGILTSPFLHANLYHLVSNTIPLIIMLSVLILFYEKKVLDVIIGVVLVSGILVWCFGRHGNHIGASGLIYGLAGFLIANGVMEKNFKSILISVVIAIMYGSLVFGLLPVNRFISWEGHLFGALSGVGMSYILSKKAQKSS